MNVHSFTWPVRNRDSNKQRVIRRKALELLVRQGLDGFSMQKLARAAKVSPATLYIYFEHRDDLIFQIYKEEMERMVAETLAGFDPEAFFASGLRVQWKNRARYCLDHPLEAKFLEQVRHSPYHELFFPRLDPTFFEKMVAFVKNAVRRKEIISLPREIFWSIAYSPLYQLLKFHQTGFGLSGKACGPGEKKFVLDDNALELALKLITKALAP